jgi:hypothetical protein
LLTELKLVKKLTLLLLLGAGAATALLSSCVNHPAYTGPNINPAYYNPNTRDFESRWPFGPAGFR